MGKHKGRKKNKILPNSWAQWNKHLGRLRNFDLQPDKCGQIYIKMRILTTNNWYEIVKEPKFYI